MNTLIRHCQPQDIDAMLAVINDAAEAYRGVIPADCWHEPYMSRSELAREIADGVVFWGYQEQEQLLGVMGLQHVADVSLIRHAYVCTRRRQQGIGGQLLATLRSETNRPTLVGTWAAAAWALRFYEKHGYRLLDVVDKERLLRRYWSISERQIATSIVLADDRWFAAQRR